MNTSKHAASGYNPWSDRDRLVAGVQLYGQVDQHSAYAADRYALLQAVADRKSDGTTRRARRRAWRWSARAVPKTARPETVRAETVRAETVRAETV